EVPRFVGNVARWVNENRSQLRIVVCLAMQKEKTRLSCDRNPDLVGQFETTASFKMLFGEEYLNMTQQFDLICARESPEGWKVAINDRAPGRGKWFRLQLLAASLFRKPKSHAEISDSLAQRVIENFDQARLSGRGCGS